MRAPFHHRKPPRLTKTERRALLAMHLYPHMTKLPATCEALRRRRLCQFYRVPADVPHHGGKIAFRPTAAGTRALVEAKYAELAARAGIVNGA